MGILRDPLATLVVGMMLGIAIGFLIHRAWIIRRRGTFINALRGNAVDWLRGVERDHERFMEELRKASDEVASANGRIVAVKEALRSADLVRIIDEIDRSSRVNASAQPKTVPTESLNIAGRPLIKAINARAPSGAS